MSSLFYDGANRKLSKALDSLLIGAVHIFQFVYVLPDPLAAGYPKDCLKDCWRIHRIQEALFLMPLQVCDHFFLQGLGRWQARSASLRYPSRIVP